MATAFKWSGAFLTVLDTVDDQHCQLVEIINQFGEQFELENIDRSVVDDLYLDLLAYTEYHFKEEEALMRDCRLDERHIAAHQEAHKRFLDEVSLIYSGMSFSDRNRAHSYLKFLIHWLAYHILGKDKEMSAQISDIKGGADPAAAYLKHEASDQSKEPLVEALDGLLEQISKRNRELRELNAQLEQKVQQRTQDLLAANEKLEVLSLTDILTTLPNRRHAMQSLQQHWEETERSGQPLSGLMIDADNFKYINDTFGHDAGDKVLVELGSRLKDSFRTDDLVCRLGGDEFFVICPNTALKDAMQIAEKARKSVAEMSVAFSGGAWQGSISVGVAGKDSVMSDKEDLITKADLGVLAAKQAGKNSVQPG